MSGQSALTVRTGFIAVSLAQSVFAAEGVQHQGGTPEVVIGTSVSLPVIGETVQVDILPKAREDDLSLRIDAPTGASLNLPLDVRGRAVWKPTRYGKHLLRYGRHSRQIWVVSRPTIFNWWSTEIRPDFVTGAMLAKGHASDFWRRRGVIRLHWIGGAHLAGEKHKPPFRRPQQWFDRWWGRLADQTSPPQQGVCLDELYATDQRVDGIAIPRAVAMLRRAAGNDLAIGVYCSGLTEVFATGMWYLRQSDAYLLEECYWGSEEIYLKRWQDVTLYRLQHRAVLVISPGFNQSERVRGSLNADALRREFATVRRVAPDAAGLGVFNAYKRPDLERLADKLIERYFLEPTVHLHPRNGNLVAQNIGHEDAEGFSVAFLDGAGKCLVHVRLRTLEPMSSQALSVPPGAKRAQVHVPERAVNIYPGGVYHFPKTMNPLQVVEASVADGAVITNQDGKFTFRATFNKPLDPGGLKPENVFLHGVLNGPHTGRLEYDSTARVLSAVFQRLPSDFYTLRLLSGKDKIRDTEGLPLDGSGNGLLDSWHDHYAVHFRLDRDGKRPVLALPKVRGKKAPPDAPGRSVRRSSP